MKAPEDGVPWRAATVGLHDDQAAGFAGALRPVGVTSVFTLGEVPADARIVVWRAPKNLKATLRGLAQLRGPDSEDRTVVVVVSALADDAEARAAMLDEGLAAAVHPLDASGGDIADAVVAFAAPPEDAEAERAARLEAAVALVWKTARPEIDRRIAALEGTARSLLRGRLTAEGRVDGEHEAHRLAGSLGTFGLPAGSRVARRLENLLAGDTDLDARAARTFADDTDELARLVAAFEPGGNAPKPITHATSDVTLAVLTDGFSGDARRRFQRIAAERGFGFEPWQLGGAEPPIAMNGVTVVVANERVPHVRGPGGLLRVVTMSESASVTDRVEWTRRGADALVAAEDGTSAAVDAAEAVAARVTDASTALVVVATAARRRAITQAFQALGWQAAAEARPEDVPAALMRVAPDVLVVADDWPDDHAADIVTAARSVAVHHPVLTIGVTDPKRRSKHTPLAEASADLVLRLPVSGADVAAHAAALVERRAQTERRARSDLVTLLPYWDAALPAIDALVRATLARDDPVSLALFDVQGLVALNAEHGRGVGDKVLRALAQEVTPARFPNAVVARVPDGSVAVVLPAVTRRDAEAWAEDVTEARRIARTPRLPPWQFRVRVASAPVDARSAADLLTAARVGLAAHAQSDRAGADAGAAAKAVPTTDVLVVDDDEAIADLLAYALRARGISHERARTGPDALAALTGPERTLKARVVLLDVNLPGLDGLSLLRQLAQDRILEDTRVVMLTGRSGEEEVMQALELGAFDHVAKPFSLQVLLERVRRALED